MTTILHKVIVVPFYKINTGFFLVLLLCFFGVMNAYDMLHFHYALMSEATSSVANVTIMCAVCMLFNLKCITFVRTTLSAPPAIFLRAARCRSVIAQSISYALIHIAIYSLMCSYAIIAAGVGLAGGHVLPAMLLLFWQLVMIGAGTFATFASINFNHRKPLLNIPSLRYTRPLPFHFWLLRFSLRHFKKSFLFVKALSLLLLQFMVSLNAARVSKENICFTLLLGISAHSLLPLHYVRFTETKLSFIRNMPASLPYRLAIYIATYALILLPEFIFLIINEWHVLPMLLVISLYMFSISRLLLFTALQYLPSMDTNKYTLIVFMLFFISVILLAAAPFWLFMIVETASAIAIYTTAYYKYQNTPNNI